METSFKEPSPQDPIFPLSPPAFNDNLAPSVIEALRLLKSHQQGDLDKEWNTVRLDPVAYNQLWSSIRRDQELCVYTEWRVRSDYDPNTYEFAIRMISKCHEMFLTSVQLEIARQISAMKSSNNPAAAFLNDFHFIRSSSLFLEEGSEHRPDEQLLLMGKKYPSLVIEVAKSQTHKRGGKDLTKLADKYIVESSGNIQTVLGLEIEYRESRKATLTVWHPLIGSDALGKFLASEAAVSEKFREDDGTKVLDKSMRLQLKHLVSSGVGIPLNALDEEVVVMTYSQLAEYLDKAESAEREEKTGKVTAESLEPGVRKRRRESTPPEALTLEDESRFEEAELGAERAVDKKDNDLEL